MTTPLANQALLQMIHGQPSYCFGTRSTRVRLTRLCGAMAPVTFFADSRSPVEPYAILPWVGENQPLEPPILAWGRGDFFCAPFGANEEPFDGVLYPSHGEPCNAPWDFRELRETGNGAALHLEQHQTLRPGRIRKALATLEGQSVIYCRHDLLGMSGPMDLGHHPILHVPEGTEPGYLSFAPYRLAHTYVRPTETPEKKGYSMLRPDTTIEDLTRVPTVFGDTTDLTRYPARRGFEDTVLICAQPDLEFAWSAFSLPALGYCWFTLKDPRVLASTQLWLDNGGRHYPPWSGRSVNNIGIEDITGFYADGLAPSVRENFLNRQGIPTTVSLQPDQPFTVNLIQGVARIPGDFGRVRAIEPAGDRALVLVSDGGQRVEFAAHWDFVHTGQLAELVD